MSLESHLLGRAAQILKGLKLKLLSYMSSLNEDNIYLASDLFFRTKGSHIRLISGENLYEFDKHQYDCIFRELEAFLYRSQGEATTTTRLENGEYVIIFARKRGYISIEITNFGGVSSYVVNEIDAEKAINQYKQRL